MNFEQPLKTERTAEEASKEIETSILLFKENGLSDSDIIKGLENPSSGKKGFSQLEIKQAFQRLRDYGFIDENGLITDEGSDSLRM